MSVKKVKGKKILSNGAVAGYVYYSKENKWKWRIIGRKNNKKMKGGYKKNELIEGLKRYSSNEISNILKSLKKKNTNINFDEIIKEFKNSDINGEAISNYLIENKNIFSNVNINLLNNKKDKIYDFLYEYINEEYEKRKNIYPKIYNTLINHKDNIYLLIAHGSIIPNELFLVPHNLSIILTTTPGYFTYSSIKKNELINNSVNKRLLQSLSPGISYRNKTGKKNQLRFFKSGDIINNVNFDFKMNFPDINGTWQGGIMKYYEENKQSSKNNNGTALLNYHISSDITSRPSWPEITENNYITNLNEIVKKFHGKKGHYVLIVSSCQYYGHYENGKPIVNSNKLKKLSIIYQWQELLKARLNCFQDLSKKIDENKEKKRLHNMSSTYKKENCYYEIMRKIKIALNNIELYKKYNFNNENRLENKLKRFKNKLETAFHKTTLFDITFLVNILYSLDNQNDMNKYNINPNNIEIPSFIHP